jgi:hypothetical protein
MAGTYRDREVLLKARQAETESSRTMSASYNHTRKLNRDCMKVNSSFITAHQHLG